MESGLKGLPNRISRRPDSPGRRRSCRSRSGPDENVATFPPAISRERRIPRPSAPAQKTERFGIYTTVYSDHMTHHPYLRHKPPSRDVNEPFFFAFFGWCSARSDGMRCPTGARPTTMESEHIYTPSRLPTCLGHAPRSRAALPDLSHSEVGPVARTPKN